MIRGDPDLEPPLEEGSQFDTGVGVITETVRSSLLCLLRALPHLEKRPKGRIG